MRLFGPNIDELKARRDIEGLIRVGKLKERRDVKGLIRALKDSNWKVRASAAYALGEIGDKRAVEPLIEALKDSYELVRGWAALALGEIGDERAVEPLIEALKDRDAGVRANAAEALGKIVKKAKTECKLLIKRLKNLGIDTKREEEKLKDALKLEGEDNSAAAIKVKECKEGLGRKINEQIERAKELVEEVCVYASVPEAEELIEKAESALKIGDYENAMRLAKQAEEKALRVVFVEKIASEINEIRNSGVKGAGI